MSFAKTLLRATTMIAALAGSAAVAHAAPMLSVEAANNTTGQMFALTGTNTGSTISETGMLSSSNVSIASNGAASANGGLATITLSATSTQMAQIDIIVTQSGLTAAQSAIPFAITFTANALSAGSTGSVSFADYVSKSNAIFDINSADAISSTTLNASSAVATDVTSGTASGLTVGGTYSETQFIRINFASDGSISASSQMLPTAVPEPASMALLGAGLFGIGMIRRRAKRD